jgi:hypothetical protein
MGREMHVVRKQSGKVKSIWKDRQLPAMYPGMRISENNKIYWETRKNRSDLNKIKRL